jgi:hypothetical protein
MVAGLTFAGLPSFCPMAFHLLASYSLIASRSAADCRVSMVPNCKGRETSDRPHLLQTPRSAYPGSPSASGLGSTLECLSLTLYQCFFTLPSVRAGNACRRSEHGVLESKLTAGVTFAISLQL